MTFTTVSHGRIACTECGRWVDSTGGVIRHSSRCEFAGDKTYQGTPVAATPGPTAKRVAGAAAEGGIAAVLTEDEIVDAVAAEIVSVSDAMNRDL